MRSLHALVGHDNNHGDRRQSIGQHRPTPGCSGEKCVGIIAAIYWESKPTGIQSSLTPGWCRLSWRLPRSCQRMQPPCKAGTLSMAAHWMACSSPSYRQASRPQRLVEPLQKSTAWSASVPLLQHVIL